MRPLGVYDIVHKTQALIEQPCDDYWFWCRLHEQAEHVSARTCCGHGFVEVHAECDGPICIRIGPCMTEAEANLIGGLRQCMRCKGWIRFEPHLGSRSHPVWAHLGLVNSCSGPLPTHVVLLGMNVEAS